MQRLVFVALWIGWLSTSVAGGEPLQRGAEGTLVETLQRTLNANVEPSPQLMITGKFDDATDAAVRQLQSSKGLPVDGRMTAAVWEALGPVVETETPETVRPLKPLRPAHLLEGPPFVTCRAWAVCDAETGEVLWQHDSDVPRDMASTTKIMTAYLVVRYAVEHPESLDEILLFSERADETKGSSAGVRAGEGLKVRDLLFGLMLPSGNDASVALAEHFGDRLASNETPDAGSEQGETPPTDYDHFVSAMNRAAKELGMKNTSYRNPHGLSVDGHASTAADLLILARNALKLPQFREIVSTRRHECVVRGPEGYLRKIVWNNSNQLLDVEGYGGVKTGTTARAGACLVSQGNRDGRSLLIAVLGSTSPEGRYTDTLNLYRWAWSQLPTKTGQTP